MIPIKAMNASKFTKKMFLEYREKYDKEPTITELKQYMNSERIMHNNYIDNTPKGMVYRLVPTKIKWIDKYLFII